MNDYEAPPNQKLNTTSSPTFASLTVGTLEVTGAATFASTVTATGRIQAATDIFLGNNIVLSATVPMNALGYQTLAVGYVNNADGAFLGSAYLFTVNGNVPATSALVGLAAASIRLGAAPSATPIAQTFTIGEASRPGTDTNVGGANGTIRSGLGTGNATGASLIFQTPTPVGSGSGVQTYETRCTMTYGSTTFVGIVYASIIEASTGFYKSGVQVVGAQGAAVADASGGATVDAEARTAINTLLARLRTHGLIAT